MKDHVRYQEKGSDFLKLMNKDKKIKRHLKELQKLGFNVDPVIQT